MLLVMYHLVPSTIYSQSGDDKMLAEELSKSGEIKTSSAQQLLYTQKNRALEPDADFEKFEIKKVDFINGAVFKAGSIDRSFTVNNPFELEDLNNPFNLARPGSKLRNNIKKKDSESFQKFFVSLFEYKEMTKKTIVNKKPELVAPAWMLITLISLLSIFAYQLVAFKAENKKTIQAFISNSSSLQQFRDQKTLLSPYKLLSDSLFALAMGHFVYVGSNVYLHSIDMDANWSITNLFLSVIAVTALIALKNVQSKLLRWVFPFKQQLNYNHFILSNSFKVVALTITPALMFMTYSPESVKLFTLYIGLFLLAASGLYSFLRMTIASSELILENKFHFFIYLCGVELAPLLILLKLLSVI
jgi:hypothetical protein